MNSLYIKPVYSLNSGPPIYYEWKLPASFLEPPHDENKSNGAITIGDNQIPVIPPDSAVDRNSVQIPILEKDLVPPLFDPTTTDTINGVKLPSLSLQPPFFGPLQASNDSIPAASNIAATNHSFPSLASLEVPTTDRNNQIGDNKLQTPRAVTTTGRTTANSLTTKRQSTELNYLDLKKQFLVPEYTFPLENIQRPSYTEDNAVNSFQIKIPDEVVDHRRQDDIGQLNGSTEKLKPWYGENKNCPECHPSFLKPNSCEPCIKFR